MNKNTDTMIEALIAKMSLREKIGQLNQPETPRVDKADQFREKVRRGEVGSILMSVGATAGNDPQGAIDVNFYNELQKIACPYPLSWLIRNTKLHNHLHILVSLHHHFHIELNQCQLTFCYNIF